MIRLLDDLTIDKIAAGEVIERPVSVVKELIENSIDAHSTNISVEIRNGGIDYIRITDDGEGIKYDEVPKAFLRHATSKIVSCDDLFFLNTLGFRGEALASISSVSHTEMITRYKDELMGTRIALSGGKTEEYINTGAPFGTTIIVKDLFYNVPARQKFLKSPSSEANKIIETVQELCISNPNIKFQLIVNKQVKIQTNGNGKIKDCIYRIFNHEIYNSLIPVNYEEDGFSFYGFIAKPEVSRASRTNEYYYVNNRLVKNIHITKGIEEGYRNFLMQHQYPFTVLFFDLDPSGIDVNVHPAKKEIKIARGEYLVEVLMREIRRCLTESELIPKAVVFEEKKEVLTRNPEPFEKSYVYITKKETNEESEKELKETKYDSEVEFVEESTKEPVEKSVNVSVKDSFEEAVIEKADESVNEANKEFTIDFTENLIETKPSTFLNKNIPNPSFKINKSEIIKEEQKQLFTEKTFTESKRNDYEILGQVFDTYWIITINNEMLIMDQHAAHEKVLFEKFMKNYKENTIEMQYLIVPTVINLSLSDKEIYLNNKSLIESFGFETEEFGENEIVLRAIPSDLFGGDEKQLILEILNELSETSTAAHISLIEDRIATRACKAAVKGNQKITKDDCRKLLDFLFTLENPYQCPHGRPTMIKLTDNDLEKMFKRIV